MMKYKDYIAVVEYDDENEVFSGRVVGIKDIISFHGKSVSELKKEFRFSIDDYFKMCKELGREPNRPMPNRFSLRLPPDLFARVNMAAQSEQKSINQFITDCLERNCS